MVFALFISCCLAVPAASQGIPSEFDSIKAAKRNLVQYGEVVDLTKTNGQERVVYGIKSYVVFVRGAVKLPSGFYLLRGKNVPAVSPKFRGKVKGMRRGNVTHPITAALVDSSPLPKGTLYVIQGEVLFQMTEKGWRYRAWKITQEGWCWGGAAAKSATACYRAREMY